MRIGFIGCGFTADHYFNGLKRYPNLELVAGTDRDQQRAAKYCAFHSIKHIPTVDDMVADPSIEMVVNLTNSSSHYEVSKKCLEAGKHIYTEKPLATKFCQSKELVELAEAKGVYYSAAPCIILGETAQTVWRALRNKEVGQVRVVYAELDDGPLHLADPNTWRSESDAPYHYREEFEVGVTIEHAGYYLSWFTAFFGPAKTITAFSACVWPDKQMVPNEPLVVSTPDVSVACIEFESGVVARLTCSLVAPYNHVMKIIGDTGILTVEECWNYSSPVLLDKYGKNRFRAERYPITKKYPFIKNWLGPHKVYPPVKKYNLKKQLARYRQDYVRGIAELAHAITEKRPSLLPLDYCLHVTELAIAIQNADGKPYQVTTTFKPLEPLDDAQLKKVLPANW